MHEIDCWEINASEGFDAAGDRLSGLERFRTSPGKHRTPALGVLKDGFGCPRADRKAHLLAAETKWILVATTVTILAGWRAGGVFFSAATVLVATSRYPLCR
jgi:hypothetical protein